MFARDNVSYANVLFLLKLLPTHFCIHWQILLVTTVVFECDFVSLIPSTFINWILSVREGYCFWIYNFNYNKIFRISTDLELKGVNHVKMIPNANIKERKTKLQPVPENIVNIRRKIVFIFLWI